jgi:peptidoglycan/LPS O-acetylase OafA/YrhL
MPRPVSSGQRYMPGLDGLRAIAVLAVIAFHEQFAWAQGGLLGVGVFFTLSGFLITSLLIGQWSARGRIQLGDFWLKRARRLLPALFVMLAVVTAWVTMVDRARLDSLRGAVGAAAGYFSNWYLIAKNQSYFARFAPPAPLDHLWSLAVEEQFYLIWPLLLVGGLWLLRKRGPVAVRWLAVPTALLAAASALLMLHLYQPGLDPTRIYEGTDTRASGLLIGAVLALLWPSLARGEAGGANRPGSARSASGANRASNASRGTRAAHAAPSHSGYGSDGLATRVLLDAAGLIGLAAIFVMIWRVSEYSPFAYRGGLVLLSIATVGVLAATAYPGTVVGMALGWRPLRWIGARSYGIYLWHFPVIVLTTPANSTASVPRAALQIAAAITLAALSWRFVEEPVRHGSIERFFKSWRASGWSLRGTGSIRAAEVAATTCAVGVVLVASAGLSGAVAGTSPGSGIGSVVSTGPLQVPVTKTVARQPATSPHASGSPSAPAGGGSGGGPLRTSCRAVAHIGDSTSDGLVSADYLPRARDRITARYEDVGVRTVVTDVSGARSVVEVLPGQVNGYDAALAIRRSGFRGCWVIALGTNDTADVAAGSNFTLMYRIRRMMAAAHGEPVMWVNVVSLLSSGPYAEVNMQRWDRTLVQACARYPNMRVFNWAAQARRSWFISDGIHYTSLGYMHRARAIADALANAFPQAGQSSGCVVSSHAVPTTSGAQISASGHGGG